MQRTKALYISVEPVGSKFAKALQSALRNKVINPIYRVDHLSAVLKHQPRDRNVFVITPEVLNKVEQFERFKSSRVSAPQYAVTIGAARNIDCKTLFARTLINATSGRGIVEFERSSEEYPRAPLYTEYIPKKAEYRIHVFGGQVIDVQQKKKKREFDADTRDTRVRNLANGYVYTRDGIDPPDGIRDLAIQAVNAVGYQYGAVDIIYNEKRNQCFVLEVNSRPGIINTTSDSYANAIISYYGLTRKQI